MFWVWPPQNIYPWQKSSSEVTCISKTRAGICCAFSWQSPENTTIAIFNSSHPSRWPLMLVNSLMKSSGSLGEIWISSGERLFPEPQIRILHKLPQSPAWSWNKRQWMKPKFSTLVVNLYFLLFNQEITEELQMFTLSLCHQARQHQRVEASLLTYNF